MYTVPGGWKGIVLTKYRGYVTRIDQGIILGGLSAIWMKILHIILDFVANGLLSATYEPDFTCVGGKCFDIFIKQ